MRRKQRRIASSTLSSNSRRWCSFAEAETRILQRFPFTSCRDSSWSSFFRLYVTLFGSLSESGNGLLIVFGDALTAREHPTETVCEDAYP
jgi:hypothetical protein